MKKIYKATYGLAEGCPETENFNNFKEAYKFIAIYNDEEEYFNNCFPVNEVEEYLEKNEYYEFFDGDNIEIIYKIK